MTLLGLGEDAVLSGACLAAWWFTRRRPALAAPAGWVNAAFGGYLLLAWTTLLTTVRGAETTLEELPAEVVLSLPGLLLLGTVHLTLGLARVIPVPAGPADAGSPPGPERVLFPPPERERRRGPR